MSTYTPTRPCSHPGCTRLVAGGGRCRAHARAIDQARGSATARGYDRAWAEFSRAWLAAFPYCGMRADGWLHPEHSRCWSRGELVRAHVTDHIVALVDGGAHCVPSNSQSLCTSCNIAKHYGDHRIDVRGTP